MIKLYKVIKTKSNTRGYWLNNGKLYKDFIAIEAVDSQEALKEGITKLLAQGEIAVFYSIDKLGYCIDKEGITTRYTQRLRLHRQRLSIREVKRLLRLFGGVTVYKMLDRYIIEVYHN